MRSIARYANNWRWTLTKAVTPVVGSFCPCALAVSFPRTGFYHIYAAFWTRDHPDMHPTVLNAYSGRWIRATGQNHPAGWNCRYWALATIGNSLQVLPQSWYRKHRVSRCSPRAGIGNIVSRCSPRAGIGNIVSRCSPRAGIGNIESPEGPSELV